MSTTPSQTPAPPVVRAEVPGMNWYQRLIAVLTMLVTAYVVFSLWPGLIGTWFFWLLLSLGLPTLGWLLVDEWIE